ncbi:ABC transporter ATP-binding protein, partial [Streptomyces scabiei]
IAPLAPAATITPRPAELEDAFMLLLRDHGVQQNPLPSAQRELVEARTPITASRGPVIVVRDLVRRFGDFVAVASTSFDVARGE